EGDSCRRDYHPDPRVRPLERRIAAAVRGGGESGAAGGELRGVCLGDRERPTRLLLRDLQTFRVARRRLEEDVRALVVPRHAEDPGLDALLLAVLLPALVVGDLRLRPRNLDADPIVAALRARLAHDHVGAPVLPRAD